MLVSPYLIQKVTNKIETLRNRSHQLSELSITPLDHHLNKLLNRTTQQTSNFDAINYLYQQCNLRTERLKEAHQLLMNSTDMTLEWIVKSSDLQNSIARIESEKQDQERKTRESLSQYSLQISRLDDENRKKEFRILETEAEKESLRKLYEEEITCSQELFNLNSSSRIVWSSNKNQQKTSESICEQNSENSQQEDNTYLLDIIKELRIQNTNLKDEIQNLKLALADRNQRDIKPEQRQEVLQLDCISFFPTQNSVTQNKHSLASEILLFGKKLSQLKDTGCFSYVVKEALDKTLTQLEISSFGPSKSLIKNANKSLVKNIIIKKEKQDKHEIQQNKEKMGFFAKLLKRFVTDRIRKH